MGRYLVINDEQGVLGLLFSRLEDDAAAADFATTLDEAKRLAGANRYDAVILQVAPSSPILNGRSMEDFIATVSRDIPAREVLWVTNFRGIISKKDTTAFGSSDFVISGSMLKHLVVGDLKTDEANLVEAGQTAGLRQSIVGLANVFQSLLDLEDPFLKGNIRFIVECCRNVADSLNLSPDVVAATEVAASVYDIGKIGLNKDLLWKKSSLSLRQQDLVNTHPLVACELLKDVPFPWEVLPIIKHHHERFDGTGYPDGLKGREIPIGARILAVVDAFHAMISQRPYRRGLNIEEALTEVSRNAGIQFDPEVVEAFFGVARNYFTKHPPKHTFTALLVDNDIKDLARLKMALELEGYEVMTARTFGQAATVAESQLPDLIVSELCLADGDGFGFLDGVRQRKELEDTVFMFLSSRNAHEDRIEAYRKGVDDFLGKPYQIGELVLKLGNVLRRVKRKRDVTPDIPKNALAGTLDEFGLPDLLQILDFGVKTALVTISNGKNAGKIYVEKGKVKYITMDSKTGQEALLEMFRWSDGGFSIEHGISIDKKNVSMDTPMLILDTLKKMDEADARPAMSKALGGRRSRGGGNGGNGDPVMKTGGDRSGNGADPTGSANEQEKPAGEHGKRTN